MSLKKQYTKKGVKMTFKYLIKPFMLVLIFAGFSITVFDVANAMWETNKSTVICVAVIFTSFWIGLLMEYLDSKKLQKVLDKQVKSL